MKSNTTRIHFLEDIDQKNVSCKCTGVRFASSIMMELAYVFCEVKFQFTSIFLPTRNFIEVLSLFFLLEPRR